MASEDREYVQSFERGIEVLRAFDGRPPRMSLSEVASRTGLARASARRFLLTLIKLDLVATDGKVFWLLPGILDLGYRYLSSLPWWQSAQPVVEDVSAQMNEVCSISVLDGTDIIYVARASVTRIISANVSIGSRFPAFCTAMGRAIVSYLSPEEIDTFLERARLVAFTERTVIDKDELRKVFELCRQRNYAVSDDELEPGLRGLAVPILDMSGRAVASLGISVQSAVESQSSLLERGLPLLNAAATRIMQNVRGQEFQPTGTVRVKPR